MGVCVWLAAVVAPAEALEPAAVAVFDIQVVDVPGFTAARVAKFAGFLDAVVAESGLRTVPRSELRARLQEQQRESYASCYDEACQIELGKAVAAQKALSATWSRLGATCVLHVKLYDLVTNLAELSTTSDSSCDEAGLRASIEALGVQLRARGAAAQGTFTLDLGDGRAIKNLPTDQLGYLKVRAVAKDRRSERIEVYINGERAGQVVNGLFTKELPVGRYVVLLRASGDVFMHQRFDVTMTPAGVLIPTEGEVVLQPLLGTLVVRGTPAQARARINGEPRTLRGELREDRRAGRYEVVVEAPGYLPSAPSIVEITPGGAAEVRYTLVRDAGRLELSGSPAGARVRIDQAPVGALPLVLDELDVGDHVVEVEAPGYTTQRRVVSIARGQQAALVVDLVEKLGRLKVEAEAALGEAPAPVEAEVYLDGAKVGTTPWKGEVRAEVAHALELRLGRERTGERTVTVGEGLERRERVEVPAAWAGAVSTLRFELVPGPWEVRAGETTLDPARAHPMRPGRVALELRLDGEPVGRAEVALAPLGQHVVSVTARPRTPAELEASQAAHGWRKWIATGLAASAAGVAVQQWGTSLAAADARDAAYVSFLASSVPEEREGYRGAVSALDEDRLQATTVAVGAGVALGALATWALVEWLWAEPERGALEGPDIIPFRGEHR